jgi:fructan beta-fructosidase
MLKSRHRFSLYILLVTIILSCKQEVVKKIEAQLEEAHRPLYHFTPDSMWMNDPNGLVYYDGEYHLFYQYYPDSTVWGPMHWGHAVSKDMIDWQDLPIALYPDSIGYIFSGSAVIDWQNTSGFGINGQPPMIAIYTYHNMDAEKSGSMNVQSQGIAYSNDKGRTWSKYKVNPVIKSPGIKDFRDPKVLWYESDKHWVMVLAARDKVKFYISTDLKSWTYASDFGIDKDPRLWECPDIFPMKVEGSDEIKWVLITSMQTGAPNGGTGTSYWVGEFDGTQFKCTDAKENQKWLDDGKDNYAFVTWSDIPATDGRRMGIGWMSNWQYAQKVPTQKWRSAMTLPRTLQLRKTTNDYVIATLPVDEVKNLRGQAVPIASISINKELVLPVNTGTYHLALIFKNSKSNINIVCYNDHSDSLVIGYNASSKKYFIDRSNTGIADFSDDFAGKHYSTNAFDVDTIALELYMDHSSIELFAENGQCAMTDVFFTKHALDKAKIVSGDGHTMLIGGSYAPLSAIAKRK